MEESWGCQQYGTREETVKSRSDAEDPSIPLPQGTIRLEKAIAILNSKGYTNGFISAGMGTPVVPQAQPMFWFCVNGTTQGISASTGDFFPDLFPCYPIDFDVSN